MKTYQDFDLTKIKDYLFKVGKEQGYIEKDLEKVQEDLLDSLKNDLKTKVHCLTCGINFPFNDLQHECQEEDIWLYSYIQNSIKNKDLKREHLLKLKKKYPLKKGHGIAFRGINFRTKEEYDAFMKEAEQGTYYFKELSSWTLEYSYAKRFAKCIQKGTRADDGIRKQEIRLMFNGKANITGYKGVILGIDVKKRMTLCDISEEHIGSMNEHEIILLSGKYPVHIIEIIDKEYGKTEWDEKDIKRAELL